MTATPPTFPTTNPNSPHVKICGLTRPDDARLALELGASFLGLILTRKSPRHLPVATARELVATVRKESQSPPRFIGVFVDEPAEEIAKLGAALDLFAVQVHGPVEEAARLLGPGRVIPAVAIRGVEDGPRVENLAGHYPTILADAFSPTAHGGTGKVFEHRHVQPFFERTRVFIAGGLNPDNIAGIVERLLPGGLPYAFDLSSGVEESPGIKSVEKMRSLFASLREALPAADGPA